MVTPTTFRYVPVQPRESSSGMYSGGLPIDRPTTLEEYDAVVDACRQVLELLPEYETIEYPVDSHGIEKAI